MSTGAAASAAASASAAGTESADAAVAAAAAAAAAATAAAAAEAERAEQDKAAAFRAALNSGLTVEQLLAEAATAARKRRMQTTNSTTTTASSGQKRPSSCGAFHAPPAKRTCFTVQVASSPFAAPDAAVHCERSITVGGRMKLLKFAEDVRPPYWGTFSKKSSAVTGRRPLG
jgi:trimeric autotransporter adhesin